MGYLDLEQLNEKRKKFLMKELDFNSWIELKNELDSCSHKQLNYYYGEVIAKLFKLQLKDFKTTKKRNSITKKISYLAVAISTIIGYGSFVNSNVMVLIIMIFFTIFLTLGGALIHKNEYDLYQYLQKSRQIIEVHMSKHIDSELEKYLSWMDELY